MHPRHVVLATGVSGIPSVPEIAGLNDFAGKVMHSSQYDDGENWKGKRAIVIGTGNSGQIYQVDSEHLYSLLMKTPPAQVTGLDQFLLDLIHYLGCHSDIDRRDRLQKYLRDGRINGA